MTRVFVVGDGAQERGSIVDALAAEGHEALSFAGAASALAAIGLDPPDVVITDLAMAELDGFELARALRAEQATRDLPVVLASAVYTAADFAELVVDCSRCVFLRKPASRPELLVALSAALDPSLPAGSAPPADFEARHRRVVQHKLLSAARRSDEVETALRILADLGGRALAGLSVPELCEEACRGVAEVLHVELVEVLELDADTGRATAIAGVGWGEGAAAVDAGSETLMGHVLAAHEVTVIERLVDRADLLVAPHVRAAGAVGAFAAAIQGADEPLGVLAAYSLTSLVRSRADETFLASVANLIGRAMLAEAARAASERHEQELRAIFEGSRDALLVSDLELRTVQANPAACELLGRSLEELLGLSALDVVPEEFHAELAAGWQEGLAEGGVRGQLTVERPDGERRRVGYNATAHVIPGFHLIALRDTTERAELEHELRATVSRFEAAERRYVELIEALPDGVLAADADGRIVLVNEAIEQMFGYTRAELLGQPVEILVPDDVRGGHPAQRATFGQGHRARGMGVGIDLRGRRKDGTEFPAELSLSPSKTEDGYLITSVITDVTGRKQLEAQLLQAQKLEAVGRLAGGIAHDFNNLLQVILGYSRSLARTVVEEPESAELAEVCAAAERASQLTRQLLAFSRGQALRPETLDLNQVVRDLETMLARMTGEGVVLALELGTDLWTIRADRGQLEQILANLTVNARDAMPGGGALILSTRNVVLNGDAAALDLEPGPYVALSVADTGSGMDTATVARAFEPFFTTKEEGVGTGLGLAMVHGIAEQSGGGARLESVPGRGTTVTVFLPRGEAARLWIAPPPSELEPVRGGTERILLVEDNAPVRRLFARTLEEFGYAVTTAADGDEALAAYTSQGPFDLVVTDFVMPGMGGRDLADRLAEQGNDPLVLFVSGYAPDGGVGDTLAGPRFLQKPFAGAELAQRVRLLLDEPRA